MRRPIPVVPYQRDIRENKVSLALLEQNYENEKELMEAVSQGKLHKVNVMASMFFNNGTEARVPDSLRNRKNYLIILKTLLRKAAEQGGVHPLYLHKSSSYYADKIEALHSIKESVNLQEEMIRNFCLLVKYNSLSTYSYIVGRAITIIGYDLQADLSLAGIAAQLNVSSAYLSGLFKKECGCTLSLNNIIRTHSTVRIFAPDFISFFDGRQPICIIQFCLTQKSTPVESKISEIIC